MLLAGSSGAPGIDLSNSWANELRGYECLIGKTSAAFTVSIYRAGVAISHVGYPGSGPRYEKNPP